MSGQEGCLVYSGRDGGYLGLEECSRANTPTPTHPPHPSTHTHTHTGAMITTVT